MDNFLQLAKSLQQLQKIINKAILFYRIVNIKVNSLKSILITNAKDQSKIKFEEEVIKRKEKNKLFRYLGCWFSKNKIQKAINKKAFRNYIIFCY